MAVLPLSDPPSYLWFSLAGPSSVPGSRSVWESPPCAKLLTLQEAQAQKSGQSSSPAVTQSSNIDMEEGPAAVQGRFHTVIDFPSESHEFDSEQLPELSVRDIHSVSSVCKMYFRELPNPLLTTQLYDKFTDAAGAATEEERMVRMKGAIQQLPAPHYRTLEYLMRHLASLAGNSSVTNMDAHNLAIVWAPNLLRSQQSQSACASGGAASLEVQTQTAVVEFLIGHTDGLFGSKSTSAMGEGAGPSSVPGSRSVWESPPCAKLLTLQEAQALRRGQSSSPAVKRSSEIEVEEDPTEFPGRFHTIIDFPSERPRSSRKKKESPAGSWCSCLCLRRPSPAAKHQLQSSDREPSEEELVVLAGESSPCEPTRARPSADCSGSVSINGELMGKSFSHCSHNDRPSV
ncbi:rho GTPase-activating protein 32-like [Coturnix japonica]|uniref:rho GTPase-activating protein 32-like n=1 Tax=Coturnix japonica TaxID=93934 RepID=UPI000777B6E3|nr:rho GTPase-activating protein 32-like [Coturnix japonica]